MYFYRNSKIKYIMRKLKKPKHLQKIVCFVLLAAIFITVPCMSAASKRSRKIAAEAAKTIITVWQIDSFEGGKGSRADFLQKLGNDFAKTNGCYINVKSLSAEAARLNLGNGIAPDIISYGSGIDGFENYIDGYSVWCNGSYCLLSVDENADFNDVTAENTVINEGKENLSLLAAAVCGLKDADSLKSTAAYVKLINGNYKYLFGTQRDIFRLKTRGVGFKVKPITEFNDLYQLLSVTRHGKRTGHSLRFAQYVCNRRSEVDKIGMLTDAVGLYDDEMRQMEGQKYDMKLSFPINAETRRLLENAMSTGDINIIKNLLK